MKNKPLVAMRVAPVERLHPRNLHRGRYDFKQLVAAHPKLAAYVSCNTHGDESVDFADPAAVRALNRALLFDSYGVADWDIPANYLCPPIPGRADYLHYLADLLAENNGGIVPLGATVRVLDIGTGANCIYPLIGHQSYGWQFVGSDIDKCALANAQGIINTNSGLEQAIELRLQTSTQAFYKGIVRKDELFDITLCNPPFHGSMAEANVGTQRKWKNLGKDSGKKPVLNFGGQGRELWCPGGEEAFVCSMIAESVQFGDNCLWFTSLISKSASLPGIYRALNNAAVQNYKTIEMAQGQKKSRFIAWTFLDEQQRITWHQSSCLPLK